MAAAVVVVAVVVAVVVVAVVVAEGEDWDLAFPQREQGSAAAEVSEAREASQQAAVRHGFASYFALLLAGYQNYLRRDASARSASPLTPGSPAAPLIDEAAFLASRLFLESSNPRASSAAISPLMSSLPAVSRTKVS